MKLVIVDVQLTEDDPEPEAKLDDGEHIVKRIVEMKDLWNTLEGGSSLFYEGVSSRMHFARGFKS
jgi:ADP-ribose pyrophosphatase